MKNFKFELENEDQEDMKFDGLTFLVDMHSINVPNNVASRFAKTVKLCKCYLQIGGHERCRFSCKLVGKLLLSTSICAIKKPAL